MALQKNNQSRLQAASESGASVRPIRRWVSWLVALILLLLVGSWMASGLLFEQPKVLSETTRAEDALLPVKVKVQQPVFEEVSQLINITGNTAPKRSVKVRSATNGTVIRLQVEKGQMVEAGQLLLQLDGAERNSRLVEAKAVELQEELSYNSTNDLVKKGLASKLQLSQAQASLESARARVDAARQSLSDIRIVAPFAGLITSQQIELGSYVSPSSELLEIVEITPTLITAALTERDLAAIGSQYPDADIELATGEVLTGKLNYIAPKANEATNTFSIEIEIYGDLVVKLGVSAKVTLRLTPVSGLKITPDQLELNSRGDLVIKYVDNNDLVQYTRVWLIRSSASNSWVKTQSLPDDARVIFSGGGFTQVGEKVDPVLKLSSSKGS